MKKTAKPFALFLFLTLSAGPSFSAPTDSAGGMKFYRYINDKGVKVLNHTIPPKYAQKGYEIVNAKGQLLKRVAPAPTAEELAKAASERQIRERFLELNRRYKNTEEIESAKKRRLSNINTNIAILEANISNLMTQISNHQKNAANFEREGRSVPASLLQKIQVAKAELAVAKDSLKIRQKEYQSVQDQFNIDLADFVKGEAISKRRTH